MSLGVLLANNLLFELQLKDELPGRLVSMDSSMDAFEKPSFLDVSKEEKKEEISTSDNVETEEATAIEATSESEFVLEGSDENGDLWEEVPRRSNLDWRKEKGQRVPLIELSRNMDLRGNYNSLYCFSHHDFVLDAGTDIDHLLPMEQIINRQRALLNYLNSDKKVAEGFMSVSGIAQYFGKQKGKILGRKKFYDECYRQLSNLWLLCHACNIKKSSLATAYAEKEDEALLDWLGKHPSFGQSFINALNGKGKIHNGILFNVIYTGGSPQKITIPTEIKLSQKKSETIDRQIHLLPEKQLQTVPICGMATFVRDWLKRYYKEALELEKFFESTLKKSFKEKLEASYKMEETEAKVYYTKLYKQLCHSLIVFDGTPNVSSESDDSQAEEWRKCLTTSTVNNVIRAVHFLKVIHHKLSTASTTADHLAIDKLIENRDILVLINSLTDKEWSCVVAKIDEQLVDGSLIAVDEKTLALVIASIKDNAPLVSRSEWMKAKEESIQYLQEKTQLEHSKNEEINKLRQEKTQLEHSKNEEINKLQQEKAQIEYSKNKKINELQQTILRLGKSMYVPSLETVKKEVSLSPSAMIEPPPVASPKAASPVSPVSPAKRRQRKNAMTPTTFPSDPGKRPEASRKRRLAITPSHPSRVTTQSPRVSTKFFKNSGLSDDIRRAETNVKKYLIQGSAHQSEKKFTEAMHCFERGLSAVNTIKRKMRQTPLTPALLTYESQLHEHHRQTEKAMEKMRKP